MVGSRPAVLLKLKPVTNRPQPGYLLIYGHEGPMPHRNVMRSIALIGREVIPALQTAWEVGGRGPG